MKLTTRNVNRLLSEASEGDVWDTDLAGFHVRVGKRGLSFRLYYRTKTNRRRMMTLGAFGKVTVAQARANAIEALAVVAQGGDPRAVLEEARNEAERQQQQTLRAYLDGPYTVFQNRRKDGKGTLRRLAKDFPDWLDKPISSLTRADVERWQAAQEAAKNPRAFSTLKRSYDALQALLAHAVERNVIPAHPLKGVKLQKPALTDDELAEQGAERRFLEPEEVRGLFVGLDAYQSEKKEQRRNSRTHGKAYLPSLDDVEYVDHVKPWILTMFYSGFRPGDLFGLRWEHVNLSFGTIRKVIEKTSHHHPEPMNFPLCMPLVKVLQGWYQQQGEPNSGLVFPSAVNGKRMAQTAMQRPWARIRKLGGLPEELQLYSLRHNFASQLVMAGVDILTVSKLMAHSSIETTIKFYSHLAPDHKRDAVELFSKNVAGYGEEGGFDDISMRC